MLVLKGQSEVMVSEGRGQGETRQKETRHGAQGLPGKKTVAEASLCGVGWLVPAWGCHPWARES